MEESKGPPVLAWMKQEPIPKQIQRKSLGAFLQDLRERGSVALYSESPVALIWVDNENDMGFDNGDPFELFGSKAHVGESSSRIELLLDPLLFVYGGSMCFSFLFDFCTIEIHDVNATPGYIRSGKWLSGYWKEIFLQFARTKDTKKPLLIRLIYAGQFHDEGKYKGQPVGHTAMYLLLWDEKRPGIDLYILEFWGDFNEKDKKELENRFYEFGIRVFTTGCTQQGLGYCAYISSFMAVSVLNMLEKNELNAQRVSEAFTSFVEKFRTRAQVSCISLPIAKFLSTESSWFNEYIQRAELPRLRSDRRFVIATLAQNYLQGRIGPELCQLITSRNRLRSRAI
jgi:hypothetical protein